MGAQHHRRAAGSSSPGRSPPSPRPPARCRPTGRCPIDGSAYFRASIVEQLPDPLTPLFAELIEPAVAQLHHGVDDRGAGRDAVRPGDVGFPTVNGYAYYAYGRAGWSGCSAATPRPCGPRSARTAWTAGQRWERESRPGLPGGWSTRGGRDPGGPVGRPSCWTGSRAWWKPAPPTTPPCRPSSRWPRPARSR